MHITDGFKGYNHLVAYAMAINRSTLKPVS